MMFVFHFWQNSMSVQQDIIIAIRTLCALIQKKNSSASVKQDSLGMELIVKVRSIVFFRSNI